LALETTPTRPVIWSCATAVPPRRFTQEEIFRLLGYTSPRVRQIFLSCGVDYRHFWADPEGFTPTETPDQFHARYREGAIHLACLAARRALEAAGLDVSQVDCILVASCTGYLCPDLATLLVGHLGLRPDVQRGALIGHGCAGALPLLQRACDHALAHAGRRVLAIAVEICSAAYYIDSSLETVVGNAICADGAAAAVISSAAPKEGPLTQAPTPQILAFQSVIDPSHLDKVGFEQREGKLRIILAAEIRDLAGPIIEKCLAGLLTPRGLRRDDIRHWVLHPGGRKVMDRAMEYLGLSEEHLRFSREVLRNYGNMSSPTALFVLNEVHSSNGPRPDDYGVLLALGPGFAAEAALLRW
jgi:predicted naringenin-chalcone synthase